MTRNDLIVTLFGSKTAKNEKKNLFFGNLWQINHFSIATMNFWPHKGSRESENAIYAIPRQKLASFYFWSQAPILSKILESAISLGPFY